MKMINDLGKLSKLERTIIVNALYSVAEKVRKRHINKATNEQLSSVYNEILELSQSVVIVETEDQIGIEFDDI